MYQKIEKIKVLLVATVQSHICQFHRPLVEMLHEHGCIVHCAARNNLSEKNGLTLDFADKVFDIPFQRLPININNVQAYFALKKIIDKGNYDYIHCNTPVGGIVTRIAARKVRRQGTKVIYTAHGFHFYKGSSRINWLIYYPIERVMAHFTDILITITKEDYRLAKPNFKTNVVHIHGVGANEDKFLSITANQNQEFRKRQGYADKFVILCVGELNKNKNQKTVINAIKRVSECHPDIILLLAGNGPLDRKLKEQIIKMNLQDQIQMLGYRTDLEKYTNACDIVVSASFREGLPLNIMEAMVCKKSVIASYNRGHKELVQEGITGFLFKATDETKLAECIEMLIQNEKLRKETGEFGYRYIRSYLNRNVKKELKEIYKL